MATGVVPIGPLASGNQPKPTRPLEGILATLASMMSTVLAVAMTVIALILTVALVPLICGWLGL
tara:strand:- start:688 stop:879 length:192 start_codon:yes stop_codon:yes gene_type:complete